MDKKAFVTSLIVDAWSLIIYVLIIIIFYALFHMGKGQVEMSIQDSVEHSGSHMFLINFLKTPVEDTMIAGLIRDWYLDNEAFEQKLRTETEAFLEKYEYETDLRYIMAKQGFKSNIPVVKTYHILINDEEVTVADMQRAGNEDHLVSIISFKSDAYQACGKFAEFPEEALTGTSKSKMFEQVTIPVTQTKNLYIILKVRPCIQ